MDNAPDYIERYTGYGEAFDKGFAIGKLVGEYDERMFFYALGISGKRQGNPASLAVFSRARDNVGI